MKKKQRILIADDAEVVTTLLTTALEIAGFDVVVAKDGQAAYDLGSELEFDLAIVRTSGRRPSSASPPGSS